jgi:hypothetical protein
VTIALRLLCYIFGLRTGPTGPLDRTEEFKNMKPASLIAIVPLMLAVTGLAQAQTACVYPQAPQTFPDGKIASKEEMVTGQAAVKTYATAVQDTYLPCLEKEKVDSIAKLDAADEGYAQKKLALEEIHAKKHNAALDELQAVADRWKEEITEFKAQDKKE